jgi:UDP-N-acetylmuramyl pentapeptide phosphotransferase/UDP-N-acetylglucosamine-1-phosphate transferase
MPIVIAVASACLSGALIVLLKPLLVRYALARPNARSSHRVPTPQGGGIAVLAACLAVSGAALAAAADLSVFWLVAAASAVVLAAVGAIDDIRPLPAGPRLLLQLACVAAVVLVSDLTILPASVPPWIQAAVLVIAGAWFVNLVNFMDGLDWITVAERAPVTAAIALLGWLGIVPEAAGITAAALCGALIGFAPFNKPVARLFLGDVGSLPIGLLVGWMLLELAGARGLVPALLLPLYYLMDATITLLRRLARRERVWEAHRCHFYQRATDHGFTALSVSAHVFGLNLLLAGLAGVALASPGWPVQAITLAAGLVLVAALLYRFATPRPRSP